MVSQPNIINQRGFPNLLFTLLTLVLYCIHLPISLLHTKSSNRFLLTGESDLAWQIQKFPWPQWTSGWSPPSCTAWHEPYGTAHWAHCPSVLQSSSREGLDHTPWHWQALEVSCYPAWRCLLLLFSGSGFVENSKLFSMANSSHILSISSMAPLLGARRQTYWSRHKIGEF